MSATIRCIDCQGPAERRNIHGWQCRQCFEANALPDTPAPEISPAEIILEAAGEIDAGIRERYGFPDPHPAYEHKIARDMELPRQLRQLAADLESRLSAARRDSERMDWLDDANRSPSVSHANWPLAGGDWWTIIFGGGGVSQEKTLREAIDSAARSEPTPERET